MNAPERETSPQIKNLTGLPCCSINNSGSLELHQLTVSEPLADGTIRLLVAIADVEQGFIGFVRTG